MTTPPWDPASRRGNLLESLSVHSVVIYGLAGWEASGYTLYKPLGCVSTFWKWMPAGKDVYYALQKITYID